jgi:hypothetical protein
MCVLPPCEHDPALPFFPLPTGKTPEEIRKTFNIKNDFTPEEEEEVRRENQVRWEARRRGRSLVGGVRAPGGAQPRWCAV